MLLPMLCSLTCTAVTTTLWVRYYLYLSIFTYKRLNNLWVSVAIFEPKPSCPSLLCASYALCLILSQNRSEQASCLRGWLGSSGYSSETSNSCFSKTYLSLISLPIVSFQFSQQCQFYQSVLYWISIPAIFLLVLNWLVFSSTVQ